MKKIIYFMFIVVLMINSSISNASLDLLVTPIKYELELQPGESTTKTAKIVNKSNKSVNIYTGVSDFEAKDNYGSPKFVRKNELVNPNQELASWITIDQASFNVGALSEKEITFDIDVPKNATPGGHYGGVFFKTLGGENSSSTGQLKINVDYGVLLLVDVDGEIIDDTNTGDPVINNPNGSSSSSSGGGNGYDWTKDRGNNITSTDNCKFGDFTSSDTDGKCFDKLIFQEAIEKVVNRGEKDDDLISINKTNDGENQFTVNNSEGENNNENQLANDVDTATDSGTTTTNNSENDNELLTKTEDKEEKDFNIEISIPFENNGNTHVKPEGKITLIDENGKEIKGIGKKVILDENGMILGEEIVDYLPINDQGGNVLPDTKRIYTSEWKGFPYEDFNEKGQKVIKYWTPGDYYSRQNIADLGVIFPWQRINEKLEQKKISAIIEIGYKNYEGKDVQFNSAKDFEVDYKIKYIGLNPYFFLYSGMILILIFLFWLIISKITKKKCNKCRKKIKKDMKICPYCGTKQKNKK